MFRFWLSTLLLVALVVPTRAATTVHPDYREPKAVFEFFFADPRYIDAGLHWIRAYMNPLVEAPYDLAPEFIDIVVVIHGTEIVTLAKHNYPRYREAVERMRYYAALGVRFKACAMAAADYGYDEDSLYDFVELVPSAMTEIVHWQQQGYGLVIPQILEKRFTIDEIR